MDASVSRDAYLAVLVIMLSMALFTPAVLVFNYRNFRKHGVLFILIAFGFLTSMATKWHFDTGLHDNGSYATNNTVVARWTYDMQVPSSSTIYVDYRLSTDTGGVWITGATAVASDRTATFTLADATNYDYTVWSDYVPPPPIHTNGVWKGYGGSTKDGTKYLTIKGQILNEGKIIATPDWVRKEEE